MEALPGLVSKMQQNELHVEQAKLKEDGKFASVCDS